MKKSTKITYIWLQALMTVFLIVGIFGIILNDDESIKSEYSFIVSQSAKFLVVSLLPYFTKKLELDIPDFIYIIFIFFCLAHYLCGEILDFFVKIKWWDSFLHTFTGMFIALLSFSFINLLNNHSENFKLNIVFAAIFAFALTVTIGVFWEIIEYATDAWTGSNMQRAYVSTTNGRGPALAGQAALDDTMKDFILDAIGAAVMCTICVIAVRKKKIKLEDISFIRKKKKVVEMSAENIEALEMKITQSNENDTIEKNKSSTTTNIIVESEPPFETGSEPKNDKPPELNFEEKHDEKVFSNNIKKKRKITNSKNNNLVDSHKKEN